MKRDLDLIREILLAAESNRPGEDLNHNSVDLGESIDVVAAHVELLVDAGYVDAHVSKDHAYGYRKWFVYRLTMQGHDYLDSVRDPEIYRETKSRLKKVGGTASLEVVKQLAGVAIKQTLGLD